jgi:DNA-binding protein
VNEGVAQPVLFRATGDIAPNRFLEEVRKKEIFTSTGEIETDSGKTNVSSIEIVLTNVPL